MTRVKLCGLCRECDIAWANKLRADYIGFVFAAKSKRYISTLQARLLKSLLNPQIKAVGVFVDAEVEDISALLEEGIIDIAQLHGKEDEDYIKRLRKLTDKTIIKAFRMEETGPVKEILHSSADYVLLDSGAGTGKVFDWQRIKDIKRPYFLAGGLNPENAARAVAMLHPFALDVSSGIESDGVKDERKMEAFVNAVRKEEGK